MQLARLRTKGAYDLWRYVPRALPYLRPYKRMLSFSGVLTVVNTFIHLIQPWPLAIMIDSVIADHPLPPIADKILPTGNDYAMLAILVGTGFALTVIGNGLSVWTAYFDATIEQRMVLDFRSQLFDHCQRLSLSFHDARQTGEFMSRINYAAASVGNVVMAFPPLVQAGLSLIGMFTISMLIEWRIALLSLVVVPLLYYSAGLYGKRIVPRLEHVQQLEWRSLSIVHEAMSMLRVIVTFGREPHEFKRFRDQGKTAVDQRAQLTVRQTLFSLIVNTITAAGIALVFGFGFYLILNGELEPGQLLVLLSYVASVYAPLEEISGSISMLHTELVALRGSLHLLDVKPEVTQAPDAVVLPRARGAVTYKSVSFSYQQRKSVLNGVSFAVEPGQRVAIVGPTGAGKTTLVSLLVRFYDPVEGHIELDGIDLRKLTLESLRDSISVVLQEPLLFSDTIAANIRYGNLDASFEDVVAAAKAAGAHDFIEHLPEGYDTEIGERGAQLSGGERQRICVARAFIKDAPILVLDEPTSSIDSKTEAVILDALEKLMAGRTSFMIAHRLSTIRHADLIVVLDHGQVVEQGTHDELLAHEGLYRQLYEAQIRGRGRVPTTARAAMVSTLSRALSESDDDVARRIRSALMGEENGG